LQTLPFFAVPVPIEHGTTPESIYELLYTIPGDCQVRGGTKTKWSFGDTESDLGEYAWFDGNWGSQTHAVGQNKPNPWGPYDMHGNVREWCADWYVNDDYGNSPTDDPKGPSSAADRVLRGGSWFNSAWNTRSAFRLRFPPGHRNLDLGFRAARTPKRYGVWRSSRLRGRNRDIADFALPNSSNG
jgi:hypothetical protein